MQKNGIEENEGIGKGEGGNERAEGIQIMSFRNLSRSGVASRRWFGGS